MDSGKKKTVEIFFDIERAKVNSQRSTLTPKNMGIQVRMNEFTREIISERYIKVRVGNPFHKK